MRGSSRILLVTAAALVVATTLAGCVPAEPRYEYAPHHTPAPATALAPLRGTIVPAGSLNRPSLCAKVDNHQEARPQYGLNSTDIVFEQFVEGGLTRYVACWDSNVPDQVGPVRSIRPMDPDIISPFGGIVAYSGGQYRFVEMMRDTVVYNAIDGQSDTEETIYRTDDKDAPHNVGVAANQIISQHLDLAPPQQVFAFSSSVATSTPVRDGVPQSTINVTFSDERYPSWTYDPATQVYLRSQEGAPDLDDAGAQIQSTNVIVMMVQLDWQYSPVPRTIMIDSGEAWVSSGGKTVHATWSKASREAPILFVDDRGLIIRIAPGNTWIEMPPAASGSVTFVGAAG
nr:MAG: hypothetical protein GM42_3235 [actinobacterium acMicro-1]